MTQSEMTKSFMFLRSVQEESRVELFRATAGRGIPSEHGQWGRELEVVFPWFIMSAGYTLTRIKPKYHRATFGLPRSLAIIQNIYAINQKSPPEWSRPMSCSLLVPDDTIARHDNPVGCSGFSI